MKRTNLKTMLSIIAITAIISACGGGSEEGATTEEAAPMEIYKKKEEPKVNPLGVGPVQEQLVLGDIDPKMAEEGEAIFTQMCTACHKMDKRHVGPALAGVVERRNPAWVMNMILDPEKMVKEDPVAKALLAEYLSPMANQNLTQEQARAVLEYFRQYDSKNAQ